MVSAAPQFTKALGITRMTSNVATYAFPDVEVLDFAGPLEVFTTASRVHGRRSPGSPAPDVLVIPGGVVDSQLEDKDVVAWIANAARTATVTASGCTDSFLLAQAGLLAGKSATTHGEDIGDLRAAFPEVTVKQGIRRVDEGTIVPSAGIAAGVDMSFHLVARTSQSASGGSHGTPNGRALPPLGLNVGHHPIRQAPRRSATALPSSMWLASSAMRGGRCIFRSEM